MVVTSSPRAAPPPASLSPPRRHPISVQNVSARPDARGAPPPAAPDMVHPAPPPLQAARPPAESDATFWRRMNSPSPDDDLPHMSAEPAAPAAAPLELLVATPAGKPLLHFQHVPPSRAARAPPAVAPLCAATVAFQHATSHRTRVLRTRAGVSLSLKVGALHVSASSADPATPADFLRALARVAVAALHARLSAAFGPFLARAPHADAAQTARPAAALATAALLDAVTHPLPYTLLAPVALPCPTRPASRAAVADVLRRGLLRARNVVTHALVFTASPPFPRRVIASAGPANRELSPTDILLLMSVAPMRPDAPVVTPERVYLQADEYAVASTVALRAAQLRLDPDDYQKFKTAVGGAQWRPEWNSAGSNVVWIMAVARKGAEAEKGGEEFIDYVENALDRSSASRDVMVSMERPWTLEDMVLDIPPDVKDSVRAVLLLERRRIIGTQGAFGHDVGMCVLQTMVRWDKEDMSVLSPLSFRKRQSLVARFPDRDLFVVLCDRRFAVCFSNSVAIDAALEATERTFVPWMRRFRRSLVPEHDTATVPPPTPLAGVLSPFPS